MNIGVIISVFLIVLISVYFLYIRKKNDDIKEVKPEQPVKEEKKKKKKNRKKKKNEIPTTTKEPETVIETVETSVEVESEVPLKSAAPLSSAAPKEEEKREDKSEEKENNEVERNKLKQEEPTKKEPEEAKVTEKEKPKITQEDSDEESLELATYNDLFDRFCDYVQRNKLVSIEALSQKFQTSKEETIKRLRELEKEGQTVGFVDKNGEYFYLTTQEIELLDELFKGAKSKTFAKKEIENLFNEIVEKGTKSLI